MGGPVDWAKSVIGKGSNMQYKARFDTGGATWPGADLPMLMNLHFLQGRKT